LSTDFGINNKRWDCKIGTVGGYFWEERRVSRGDEGKGTEGKGREYG
jgi:hypothetical protein